MLPTDKRFHRNLFQNARSGHILTGYVRLYFNIWVIAHNITKRKKHRFPAYYVNCLFQFNLNAFLFLLAGTASAQSHSDPISSFMRRKTKTQILHTADLIAINRIDHVCHTDTTVIRRGLQLNLRHINSLSILHILAPNAKGNRCLLLHASAATAISSAEINDQFVSPVVR